MQGYAEPIRSVEDPVVDTLPTPTRRTKRKTAGKHRSKFKQLKTAVKSSITVTANELSVYLV